MERHKLQLAIQTCKPPPEVLEDVPLQDPPRTANLIKTYSKRPQNFQIAKQFLCFPTFELLLYAVGVDVKQFDNLVNALPPKSQTQEFFSDFRLICDLSQAPPKELSVWCKHSAIWQINHQKSGETGQNVIGTAPVRELFKRAAKLPSFLRNITTLFPHT